VLDDDPADPAVDAAVVLDDESADADVPANAAGADSATRAATNKLLLFNVRVLMCTSLSTFTAHVSTTASDGAS
jgi:hypothetical protein